MKFQSFSDEWEHLRELGEAELRGPNSVDRALKIHIVEVKQQGRDILMKIRGIEDIDATRPLVGLELWAPRRFGAPRRDDEYYVSDLVGLAVRRAGSTVGTISAVWSTGASDYLEVKRSDGSIRHIPFLKRYVSAPLDGVIDILDEEILE